ncbi:MAG: hypothetical protein ABSG94_05575 [Brevinematales bacterium]
MENEERISLIRRGNELFNQGDYKNSLKIFLMTDYKDGIIRVADFLYFDKKDKVSAVKLYKKAGHQKVIDEFSERVALLIKLLLSEDKVIKEITETMIEGEEASSTSGEKSQNSVIKEWKPIVIKSDDISGKTGQ